MSDLQESYSEHLARGFAFGTPAPTAVPSWARGVMTSGDHGGMVSQQYAVRTDVDTGLQVVTGTGLIAVPVSSVRGLDFDAACSLLRRLKQHPLTLCAVAALDAHEVSPADIAALAADGIVMATAEAGQPVHSASELAVEWVKRLLAMRAADYEHLQGLAQALASAPASGHPGPTRF